MRQIWEFTPTKKLVEPPGWTTALSHPILEIAFSPDGNKLAVTMDDHYDAGTFRTHLLILDAHSPQKGFRQFDLETCGNFVSWAPDGNSVLVCGTIVQMDSGHSCDLRRTSLDRAANNVSNTSYRLSRDHAIRSDRTTTDRSCRPLETWEAPGTWGVAGTEPADGRILLRTSVQRTIDGKTLPYNSYAIADRDSHALTSNVFLRETFGEGAPNMLHDPDAVCLMVEHAGEVGSMLKCWQLPQAAPITVARELAEHGITRASDDSPVVVAERWGFHFWDLPKSLRKNWT